MKLKPKLRLFILALIAIGAVVLLILPATYFDTGQSMCVSVMLFNIQCYGCGMTRAIQHLIHLDFESAYEYNKLAFIVLPLIVYMYLWEINRALKELKANTSEHSVK